MEGICKYIFFTYPFGWEELGIVATVAAVIVALFSNHSAKKQLIAALKMQEQSKNVSLLEERLKVAEAIRTGEAVSVISVKVLYNEEIVKDFQELQVLEGEYNEAASDEANFLDVVKEAHSADLAGVERKIREYTENYLERPDCTEAIWEQFRDYCNQHTLFWANTGFSDDRRVYNYYEIYTKMVETHKKIAEQRKSIVSKMEKFLSESIKQVDSAK